MLLPRVIPCLLLSRHGLVKTVRFKSPQYIGDPINAIKILNEKRVDELILIDITAGRERGEPNYTLLEQIANECYMPLCYGGGVTSLVQAKRIVNLGVEKISINHAAIKTPELVGELVADLGSSSVIVSLDVKRNWRGQYRIFDSWRRRLTHLDPFEHASRLVSMGAGEVFVNDVDRDGTQQGYDLELIKRFTRTMDVPVVACGGAWEKAHLRAVVKNAGASAAAAGSMFVYYGRHKAVLIQYPEPAELDALFK